MLHLFKKSLYWGFFHGKSTAWENTGGCTKQYKYALGIYLMTVLSSIFGIIIDFVINVPGCENNIVDGIDATDKQYFKE